MKGRRSISIGTSGWYYEHWRGPFYPQGLGKGKFLSYYTSHFETVEINNTFYQLPKRETLFHWRDTTPAGFIFSVKASRFITHMKKLKGPDKALPPFFKTMEMLQGKMGPIIFQLPPAWRFNGDRFEVFLKALPREFRYAFEFRDPTWFNPQAYEAMAKHGVAFCIYELGGRVSPQEVTTDFVYLRLHGPQGPYQGHYSTEVLTGWAKSFSAWTQQGKKIFCYFDNNQEGYAAQDALKLKKIIQEG